MFNKVKDKTKKQLEKDAKKHAEDIENAKSQEQRDYEKMQEENKEAALAYAKEAITKLASMGWQWMPIMQIPNPRQPNLAVANMAVMDISWDLWQRRLAAEKAANAEKAPPEAKGEGSEAGVEAPVDAPVAPESSEGSGTAETTT